jgi:leader peptidase (prepilin peptidase)/N-methyltransferase
MVLGYAGWVTLPAALIFAILAAFVGVVLARTIRMIRSEPAQSHIALGPFLALGSALALAVS